MARLPTGEWVTTMGLIEDWIRARNSVDPYCHQAEVKMAPVVRRLDALARARFLASGIDRAEVLALLEDVDRDTCKPIAAE
jgi:hypothetical protein